MKALAKLAPGRGNVGLADREGRAPDRGEVTVQVAGAGVCGTDLHILEDEFRSFPPVTMGHEVSGVVAALGEGVDEAWLGARVVCETFFSTCATCDWCRDGRPNLCPDRRSIGSGVDGGFAREVVVPARNLHRIPDWLDEHAAVLAEPLACVCNCLCDPSRVNAGDDVLVLGPGPVGLLAAQVARALGGRVLVLGLPRDQARLAVARGLGLDTAYADDQQALARYEPRLGADVVVECSGSAAGISSGLAAVRKGGRYVQVGFTGKPITISFDEIFFRELTVTSGFASTPQSWRRAVTLIETRVVDVEPLVSEIVALDEWERVFADTRAGRGIKFVFDPRLGGE